MDAASTNKESAQFWSHDGLLTALADLNPVFGANGQKLANNLADNPTDLPNLSDKILTDSRAIAAGDIFLAIKGERLDGHDYLPQAYNNGAALAIVSRFAPDCALLQLKVDDTRRALGQLGAFKRGQLTNLTVIALTGSSGKTTVKEMLGSILRQVVPKESVLITHGNLNNDLGVPMMLLELTCQHRFAVLELGANHRGEIAYTASLARPDVACVLNIGTAHVGEFGGRAQIAAAKAEIFSHLAENGVAVLPFGSDYYADLARAAAQKTTHLLTFGARLTDYQTAGLTVSEMAQMGLAASDSVWQMGDVFVDEMGEADGDCSSPSAVQFLTLNHNPAADKLESAPFDLHFLGDHNAGNAAAAAACALAVGDFLRQSPHQPQAKSLGDKLTMATIANGLTAARPIKGRLTMQALGAQFAAHLAIDDSYNANPDAVLAAAAVLAEQGAQLAADKWLVLGDIGELGADSARQHSELGEKLAQYPLQLLTVGALTANAHRAFLAARQCDGTDGDGGQNGDSSDNSGGDQSASLCSYSPANSHFIAKHFASKADLSTFLQAALITAPKTVLLFKGSRFMAMESLIADLLKNA